MNIAKNMIGGFPSSISLFVPNGEYCEIRAEYGKSVLNWEGEYKHILDVVQIRILVNIYAVPVKDGVYLDTDSFYDDKDGVYEDYEYYGQLLQGDEIGYFDVSVKSIITDGNTQLSRSRKVKHLDTWSRDFKNQGAETLDGAKAIAEANIREAYREYLDYIYSEREYDTHIDGRSNVHVTVNSNDWNYNFGDTQEDMDYLNWQLQEHRYPYSASTKKSKSVSKASPYTLDWCGDKLSDALEILNDCFRSNYTSSHHSFFDSILQQEYGFNTHTLIQAIRTLRDETRARRTPDYTASARKSKAVRKSSSGVDRKVTQICDLNWAINREIDHDMMNPNDSRFDRIEDACDEVINLMDDLLTSASARKSIKSDVEQFSAVVKSIRDRR